MAPTSCGSKSTVVLTTSLLLAFCVTASLSTVVTRRSNMKPPLIAEESTRKNRTSADCQFGKRTYELEETWFPDLGPPFGTMYCIRCECIAVQKKKRITGRTLCKNIKNECPKLTCDEPVLLPGSCCKVCPDEITGLGPLKEDVSLSKDTEEDDKQGKEYAAILTRATGSSSGVATARFTFHKKSLYFSVLKSSEVSSPRLVQFMKEDGSIIEEQELEPNDYFEATGKVCGVWRKIPRVYRQLLREEKLLIALIDGKDSEPLIGRLSRYKALSTELLSTLLITENSARCPGCGGTAAVSIAGTTNSVHITVAVKGLIAKNADGDVLLVRLETVETGSHPSRVIEELVTVQKAQEVNVIEVRTVLESQEMRQLMRGHVVLIVQSKANADLKLRGAIGPRVTCDLWDSLLTGSSSSDPVSDINSQGLAWFYVTRNGLLHYHVNLTRVNGRVSNLTIEAAPGKNKRKREVEDLTGSLNSNWASGTVRLSAKDYELLYDGELYLNVATSKSESELRGRIIHKTVSDSHLAVKNGPILLSSAEGSRTGLAWAFMDKQCVFHYEVDLKQSKKDQQGLNILELVHVPKLDGFMSSEVLAVELAYSGGDGSLSASNQPLEEFAGGKAENSFKELSVLSMARIAVGSAYFKVTEPSGSPSPGNELQGWLTKVKVPDTCLPTINTAEESRGGSSDQSLGAGYIPDPRDDNEIPQSRRCFYENKFYEDGTQWNAKHDRCSMCSCHRGRVACDPVLCPALNCEAAAAVKKPGECCSTCSNSTVLAEPETGKQRGCFVDGDQKFHPPGSQWHPYIPPFGFSKCAVCTCNPLTLKAECTRITCAPLNCLESEAFRPDPAACCKQCPTPSPLPLSLPSKKNDWDTLDEEAQIRSEAEILASGGCRFKGELFENGEEWHPRVQPWGEMKCINCNCKEGKVKCKRKRCPKSKCVRKQFSNAVKADDECCPACPEDGASVVSPSVKKPARQNSTPPPKKNKSREEKSSSGQKLKRRDT